MNPFLRRAILAGVALAGFAGRAQARDPGAPGLEIQKNVVVGTKRCDVVTWTDANGKPRSAAFVRADGDHAGFVGGYIQQYTYFVGSVQKTGLAWDAAQESVSGLGCAVNHHGKGASSSKANSTNATTGFVFEGAHHCLWRFHSTYSGAGSTVGLTLDWVVQDGRNDVLWAVSYDCTGQPTFGWDARGPYFQFDWDGDGHFYDGAVSGIRWGDHYRFRTTTYAASQSAWDYSEPNVIPFMSLYKDASLGDVESGVVQTQSWADQDAGGYWWAKDHWGQKGTGMMQNWNCPFQLNAYEGKSGYEGEKMAWGTNFGFVGNPSYDRLDYTKRVGAPHQGYSTYIILNRHSEGLTDAMIGSLEAVQKAVFTATRGAVVKSGPRYAGLSGDAPYHPEGWNHVYGAWAVRADGSGSAGFNLSVPAGALVRPLFIIDAYSSAQPPAAVTLGGAPLVAGKDYAASVDAAGHRLWMTLYRNLSGGANPVTVTAR